MSSPFYFASCSYVHNNAPHTLGVKCSSCCIFHTLLHLTYLITLFIRPQLSYLSITALIFISSRRRLQPKSRAGVVVLAALLTPWALMQQYAISFLYFKATLTALDALVKVLVENDCCLRTSVFASYAFYHLVLLRVRCRHAFRHSLGLYNSPQRFLEEEITPACWLSLVLHAAVSISVGITTFLTLRGGQGGQMLVAVAQKTE